jgi:protein-S-isoprenylcysteine O-methyltransferase Ste14
MSLVREFEKTGNLLFRYRGQIPVILFPASLPFLYQSEDCALEIEILALLVALLGFMIRAYAIGTTPRGTSGRNTREQVAETINTSGIYSVVRHPLYLGNYGMWAGIVIYTGSWSFFLIFSLAYWIYYERIMFAEERFLERKFGQAFLDWAAVVPSFLPGPSNWKPSAVPLSLKTILRREYSGILATALGFAFVNAARHYFILGSPVPGQVTLVLLGAAVIWALVFRTLKRNTRLLNEEGRS